MFVTGLHHVSINVADTTAAVRFYVDVLGFREIPRPDFGFGGARLQFGDGGELHLLEFPVPEAKGQHFALRVDDMDDALATLADKGVVPERVSVIEGICRQAFLTDPSGNEIELNQPL